MSLPRTVVPETLDGLAADDPAAMRSRRDLRRVHGFMRTVAIVVRALRTVDGLHRPGPFRVLELGAGDGTLMLSVARALGRCEAAVELTLLDRLAIVDAPTIDRYAQAGWRADATTADVLDWAADAVRSTTTRWDLVVANLFLHHFEGPDLARILAAIAACSDRLFACEPRRARIALAAARLTGLIGANAVTREDAVLSVHAGFRDRELTATWPSSTGWVLCEDAAGLFSHCFDARREGTP